MVGLTKPLFERRVPHVVSIYAAASWGLVECVAFLTDEFLLSPHLPRVAVATVLLLVPTVVMLAWYPRPARA